MTITEFIDYIESLMTSKETFYRKFTADEDTKNARRLTAKRWNDTQIERAVDKHWLVFMTHIYHQVETKVKATVPIQQGWLDFISAEDFISSLDESIHEMELA